ncbi:GPR1/FUN34/YaaH family transporter [Streptomyces sp. NPDC057242]|uniref:GPR1/FUN34/YaaH family transporter n=1 Tax=unclassified Streptomyces TaxID=2593676 RepID=UPI003645F403
MDNDVAAGNTSSTLGRLALGLTLLAFGLGGTGVIDNVAATDAAGLATWVGGVTLFLAGLLALRAGDAREGTAHAALGAFWFTWGTAVGGGTSADAVGVFLLLWALLALTLTLAASGGGLFGQGVYGLLFVALLLLGVGALAGVDGLGRAGGWVAAVAGLLAWYGATAAVASRPALLRRRAPGEGAPAAG